MTPSILSAVLKIRYLLTREEKLKWSLIFGLALISSFLEIITAGLIVIFAQSLNQPEIAQHYLIKVGFKNNLSHGEVVFYIAIMFGALYIIKNALAMGEIFYQTFTIQKINHDFKNKLLHRFAQSDYQRYLSRNSSYGYTVVASDTEQMFMSGMMPLAYILSETVIFLGLIAMIVWMDASLALMLFGFASLFVLIFSKLVLPKFYQWGKKLHEASLYVNKHLFQFFNAFKEIVLLRKHESFVNAFQKYSYKKYKMQAIQTAASSSPRMIIETLFVSIFIFIISYLCLRKESPSQILGILGGYLYVGFRLMPGLNRIINQLSIFKATIPTIERVFDEYNALKSNENYVDLPTFSFEKTLELKNLDFRYRGTNREALKNISLEIKKGECIGIVGETGSGKSTLIDIILGLLRPVGGSILIDGNYDVNSYQWHQRIGYVPQMIYLTDDTIEANIAFGEQEICELKLRSAIEDAQLGKFIQQLPQQTKTMVGERGVRLSGGERQRIAIARALYRNPDVLIFDEATSALDNETEVRLMETIKAVSKNRTVIMIAHRLTTLKDCDSIIVMSEGRIQERTNYEKLCNSWEAKHA